MRRLWAAAWSVAVMLSLSACGLQSQDAGSVPGRSAAAIEGDVNVLAAASLTESFTEIGAAVEERNPGLRINFSFGPSSGLAEQIIMGAPADVFAAADATTMQRAVDNAALAGAPSVFARNTLQIATPPGNPAGVRGLADLARDDLRIAICAPEVPCGRAADDVFQVAGVTPAPDTLESDVKAALSKVLLGEVDAALVYRTDVQSAGEKVEGIDLPEAAAAVNDYPIAALARAPNPHGARAFVDAVRSPAGREVLLKYGFDVP